MTGWSAPDRGESYHTTYTQDVDEEASIVDIKEINKYFVTVNLRI